MPDETADLKARLAALEEAIRLQDRVTKLEKRVSGAPGGSPAAIPVREHKYLIAPHPGGPSQIDRLRAEFVSKGGYEKL